MTETAVNLTDPAHPTQAPDQPHPLHFSGSAREYFSIWLVNLLLSICTLGIYAAWAKVRTLRWFYGHTRLDGHSFDYHATGWQILKGRLLALLLIGLMALLGIIHPVLQVFSLLGFAFLVPWAINASLRFQMRMSSWRNVRFDFSGTYGSALWIYVGLPTLSMIGVIVLVTAIVAGIMLNPNVQSSSVESVNRIILLVAALMLMVALVLIPIFARMRAAYLTNNTKFGTVSFATNLLLKRLYRLVGRSVLAASVVAIVLAIPICLAFLAGPQFDFMDTREYRQVLVALSYLTFYVAAAVFFVHFTTHVRNEAVNCLTIAETHRMHSTLSPWKVIWILASNAVVVVMTLGLMLPWARVRHHRYICAHIRLIAAGDLNAFVSANTRAPSSFGGEFGAMEGIATGLGI